MIRILQIGLHRTTGGIETLIMNYYRHLDRSQFSFDFVDMDNGIACAEEICSLGGRIFPIGFYKLHPISSSYKLNEILNHNHYNIVHFHMGSAVNIAPLKIALLHKESTAIIGHSHGTGMSRPFLLPKKILHNLNVKHIHEMPIEKWACSMKAGQWLWGDSFDKNDVIPNAVDTNIFRFNDVQRKKIRGQCGFQSTDRVIGFVGRIQNEKNIMFLCDILFELKKYDSYKLLIIGKGTQESALRNRLEQLGLIHDTYFIGMRENVAPWYSAMDAFVLPSLFEGLPLVGVEAQACKVPCFVSDKVTKELDLTHTVQFIPIDQGAEIWAHSIHKALQKKVEYSHSFPQKYDITYATFELQKRYVAVLENGISSK